MYDILIMYRKINTYSDVINLMGLRVCLSSDWGKFHSKYLG